MYLNSELMKYILIIFFNLSVSNSFGQRISLQDIKGIWVGNLSLSDYKIIKQDTMLSIGLIGSEMIVFRKDKIGFLDKNNPELLRHFRKGLDNFDSSEVRLVNYILPDYLTYLVQMEQKNKNDYFYWDGILCHLALDELPVITGTQFELINANVFGFTKVNNLPNTYLNALYIQSIKDKKNYCKEFLGKDIKLINGKSIIYTQPNKPSKMYLIKGDPVEIITKKVGWLKIKFYPEQNGIWTKKTIEGWIKQSDLE